MVCLLRLVPTNSSQLESFFHLCTDSLGLKLSERSLSKSTLKLGERDLSVEPLAVERLLVLCRQGEPPRLREKSSWEDEVAAVAVVASWTLPSELEQLDEASETFSGEQEALRVLAILTGPQK